MKYNLQYTEQEHREKLEEAVSISHLKERTLSFQTFEDAQIIPPGGHWSLLGGVFRADNTFVESSAIYLGEGGHYGNEPEIIEETISHPVIYLGWVHNTWGHCITDCLKKIWFISTEKCKEMLKDGAELIYVQTYNQEPVVNILNLFLAAGVDLKQCHRIVKRTLCKHLILPDDCFLGGYESPSFTKEYVDLRNKILGNTPSKEPFFDKIYFTRTGFPSSVSRDYGEQGIEKVFQKLGYKIIHPEELSFQRQVSLLSHCSSFAATEGSVSHNALFCKPGTKVTIIRKCNFVNQYQAAINQIADLNVTYIDANHSVNLKPGMEWNGPFFLSVNSRLKKYAGKPIFILCRPYYTYLKWWHQRFYNHWIYQGVKRIIKWQKK